MSTVTSAELGLVLELLELRRDARGGTLADRRAEYERAAVVFAEPGAPVRALRAGPCPAEWLADTDSAAEAGPAGAPAVLVYLHGGSYALGSPRSHRHLARALGRASGAGALVLDFRLAPEHPFPAGPDDAVGAYEWLLDSGVDPASVVLAGDSAGACLAVATATRLRDSGRPPPAGLACLSPWVELSCSLESHRTHAGRDPLLDPDDLRAMAAAYLAGADPGTPLASPVHADLGGLPPLLIQVGSEEVLRDDAYALADAARAAGTTVTLREWDGMFHVWSWYHPVLPEGAAAVTEAGDFLRRCLAAAEVGEGR